MPTTSGVYVGVEDQIQVLMVVQWAHPTVGVLWEICQPYNLVASSFIHNEVCVDNFLGMHDTPLFKETLLSSCPPLSILVPSCSSWC